MILSRRLFQALLAVLYVHVSGIICILNYLVYKRAQTLVYIEYGVKVDKQKNWIQYRHL